MHKWFIGITMLLSVIVSGLMAARVYGDDSFEAPLVVIAQIQAGGPSGETNAAANEFVSVYNNGDNDIDVTNWCLTNKTGLSFTCLTARAANITLYLPSHTYATFSSDGFAVAHTYLPSSRYSVTNTISGSIVGSGDMISLVDATGRVIDSVAWATTLAGGSLLQRVFSLDTANQLIDTGANTDFQKLTTLIIPPSGLIEQEVIVDVCTNIDGVQSVLPNGYELNGSGDCAQSDVCPNLPGIQSDVPSGYKLVGDVCVLDLPLVRVTELLPNPVGSDSGSEFIELYNPNDTAVDLAQYLLKIGNDTPKTYSFPAGSTIEPKSYRVFYNSEINFTLINTSSKVSLVDIHGGFIDESLPYNNPADGMAWALIDDVWQYTNQPTPGSENQVVMMGEGRVERAVVDVKECPANQYRNPDTNRCRQIVVASSNLIPCKDGQYRSEETNRCRSIASDAATTLTPCASNQERNPETNRCRLIASVQGATTTACKEGQERNTDTNRCRTIVKMATAHYPVEPTHQDSGDYTAWFVIGGIGSLALGYGIWEWRQEIIRGLRKLRSFMHFGK